MPTEFQEEVAKGVKLTHSVDTEEKNLLPTAEDVQQAKTEEELREGIESFDKDQLSHCEPEIKSTLPTKEVIETEKIFSSRDEVIGKVESFNTDRLSHVEPKEDNSLPTIEHIRVEQKQQEEWKSLHEGVEKFERKNLQPTKTEEKFIMPQDEIARNKVRDLAAKFDHNKLKKAETKETHSVAVINDQA